MLAIIVATISTYFIIKTYGATGIANTKNEETLVRMAAAKAMAQNSNRSFTRDQVASAMGNYESSSSITVTDYTEKVTVKYNSTGNTYTIYKGKTYTVTYNANGGSGAPAAQTKLKGTNLTLSSTKPTRSNYTFQGWGTSASDTSVDYAAGATYSTDSNITLYAIWKANQTEYFNGGTNFAYTTYGYGGATDKVTVGNTIQSNLTWETDQLIIRFEANLTNIKTLTFVFDSVTATRGDLLIGVSTDTRDGYPNAYITSQWTKYQKLRVQVPRRLM